MENREGHTSIQPPQSFPVEPVTPPTPRSSFKLLLVSLTLILFGILTGVLAARFLPLRTNKAISPTPSPSITITPSSDERTDWITHTDPEAKYVIKYPPVATFSSYTNSSVDIIFIGQSQLNSGRTQSELFDGYKVNVSYNSLDPRETLSSTAKRYHEQVAESCPVPEKTVISPLTENTLSGALTLQYSVENCLGDSTSTFLVKGDTLFVITAIYAGDPLDKLMHYKEQALDIVSTFMFLDADGAISSGQLLQGWYWGNKDQKLVGTPDTWIYTEAGKSSCWHKPNTECSLSSPYSCPSTSYVDCMPGPDTAGIKFECTPEYLNWAKTNCPGFQGAAY